MAVANIRAVITAEDKASQVVKTFGTNVDKANNKIQTTNRKSETSFIQLATATAGMGYASSRLIGVIDDSINSANKYQNALLGLASISRAFGHDVDRSRQAAESLAKDGLLTVADAARGLKNLLQSGFSLDQATTLMHRFKDSAAFGRQNALSFGEAVASATEGIKNGNSILVDNAGVTKNLSVILEEAGFSAQDLMRATTDASVRQALFNGIIKETNANVGDAEKLTGTYAGQQARLSAQTTILKQQVGEALQPALAKLLETITPTVERFAKFAEQHPGLVANLLIVTTVVTGLIAVLGSLGLAIIGLTPIFHGMAAAGSASAGIVMAAFHGLRAVVSTPLVMPALVVVAAIASLKQVLDAVNAIRTAINDVNNASRAVTSASGSNDEVIRKLRDLSNNGTPEQKQRAKDTLRKLAEGGAFAGGTSFAPGGLSLVGEHGAELVNLPKGSQVIPNNKVGQHLGGQLNISVNVGVYAGTEMEKRKLAAELFKSLQDVAGMRGVSVQQMLRG